MEYKVKNNRTGKFLKNGITGKAFTFTDMETAEVYAKTSGLDSIQNATAWNSARRSAYSVVAA